MIAKNKKGKSFGGCVRYVMNEGCEVLAAEGVLADDAATIIRDFAIQRSGRPEIKQPVGHIAVSFSPEDSPRMTSDFMLTLAHEYMAEMGIHNTQYIVVRHHNTDHDHFHIVYNRIDNDLKLISVNNDYRRNVAVCKKLKDCHHLTYGTGKERVNRTKLTGTDMVKYQIHDEIAANLPKCATYSDLEKRLRQAEITVQYKYRRGAEESPENIQGVSFCKGDYSFKGSDIDRKFSHANLSETLKQNLDEWFKVYMEPEIRPVKRETERATTPVLPSPEPSKPQVQQPSAPQVSPKPSAPETPKQMMETDSTLTGRPAEPPRQAQSPTTSEQQEQQQYVPQEPPKSSAPEASKQPKSPHTVKRNPIVGGIQLNDEQNKTLLDGGYIFLDNMEIKDGSGKFSSFVFLNDEKNRVLSCAENPDTFVKYGKYEMRMRDKILVEKGHITRATVKWWGGGFARPYLWKENPADTDYKESWSDPRIPKEQIEQDRHLPKEPLEQERQASDSRFRRPPAVNRTPPSVNRTIPPPRTTPPKRTAPPPSKRPKWRR